MSCVNRVQVVLSGFSVRLLCFAPERTLCRYVVGVSWLHSCVCVCVCIGGICTYRIVDCHYN